MAIPRIQPTGWAFGQKLTSDEMNQLDLDHTNAVDKRVGTQEVDSHTAERVQPLIAMPGPSASINEIPVRWYFDIAVGTWVAANTGPTAIVVPLTNVPDKSTLTALRFVVRGELYTALPSQMPTGLLRYIDANGIEQGSNPALVTDSSNLAAFNTVHVLTLTLATPITVDHASSAKDFYAQVTYTDTGATGNSRRFSLRRIEADFTITKLTPG